VRKFAYSVLSVLATLILLNSTAQAQEITLTVDRDEVARGETLTLTIRVFEQRQGMQLDLTPLTSDFDVLGTRTSSQIRSINGTVESWTDYIVTLFPLNEGELEIPPLDISGQTTEPIVITVVNEGPRSNQSDEELFLEIEVNKGSVYVQEQLLFTVRLYYTINGIRNPQFTELEMPETVIQLIGSPNQYEKLIDGQRFGVYEKRYVIFPQRSGPLEIPDILFRGEVTDGSSNFVFRNLNTRRVTAFIEGVSIDIKERPAAVQNSEFWLPVSGLSLEESWSTDLNELRVGDSVVRTVTMVAEGLDGAVLPPFSPTEIEGLNLYPDPADIQRTFVEGAIVGTRVETTTVVPIQEGNITIPEISIPWWNVDTDQLEATVIPATRFTVANIQGIVPAEQTIASTENLEDLLAAAPELSQDMINEQAQAEFIEVEARWLNYAIVMAFLIVAFSIYKLVLTPNKEEISAYLTLKIQQFKARYAVENNESVAYRQLLKALANTDLNRIREALIAWCNHFLQNHEVISMEDILQQQQARELHQHVNAIQSILFDSTGSSSADFNPSSLANLITSLRKSRQRSRKQESQEQQYALPPLYKS
jgi:uncharacterized protein YjgD (DUF1641 family)